jgi:hypothetical protein
MWDPKCLHLLKFYVKLFSINNKIHCFKLIPKYPIVCVLLGISPASDCDFLTFRNPLSVPSSPSTLHPAFEDGTDRGFRNVGKSQSDAGEIPKRTHTIFKTRRKFEIKNQNTPFLIYTKIPCF